MLKAELSSVAGGFFDPIGSIVGLRVLYLDGKLCYVPVEPQLNYMINQQFGNGFCVHCARRNGFFSAINNGQLSNYNGAVNPSDSFNNSGYREKYAVENRPMLNSTAASAVQNSQQMRQDVEEGPPWTVQHPQPRSGIRRSSLWYGGESTQVSDDRTPLTNSPNRKASLAHYTAATGSLPNLSKRIPSDAEQHKLELLKQIEENKRRRQLELEKEKMEEQKEIERLERYNEKMRKEKEEEERKLRERARQAEKRNEQMYEPHPRPQRRRSSPPPPRKEQRRSPSPSEAPALEWWEKKPSWQQRAEDDRVIPTLGGKPPRTPSRRALSRHSSSSYDPAASVENHQSREASRASHRSEQRPPSNTKEADTRGSHRIESRPPSNASASSTKLPRRASRQDSQSSLRNDDRRMEESYAPPDNLSGDVARDAHGRPMAFVIT
nr:Hypothetical protein CBG17207 [Haemonchus contortus]